MASPNVLLIEDNPRIASQLRGLLESMGLSVALAADGIEGLLVYNRELPQLVITEQFLPMLSGEELVSRLRGVMPPAQLPVMMLVSSRFGALTPHIRAQINLILEKPLQAQVFRQSVQQVLQYSHTSGPVRPIAGLQEKKQLFSLWGELGAEPMPGLLFRVKERELSGVLTLALPQGSRRLVFREGALHYAESTFPDEQLIAFLQRRFGEGLQIAPLERIVAGSNTRAVLQQEALLRAGTLSANELTPIYRAYLENVVGRTLFVNQGQYHFVEDHAYVERVCVGKSIALLPLVLEGVQHYYPPQTLFQMLQPHHHKWCEISPGYSDHVPALMERFPAISFAPHRLTSRPLGQLLQDFSSNPQLNAQLLQTLLTSRLLTFKAAEPTMRPPSSPGTHSRAERPLPGRASGGIPAQAIQNGRGSGGIPSKPLQNGRASGGIPAGAFRSQESPLSQLPTNGRGSGGMPTQAVQSGRASGGIPAKALQKGHISGGMPTGGLSSASSSIPQPSTQAAVWPPAAASGFSANSGTYQSSLPPGLAGRQPAPHPEPPTQPPSAAFRTGQQPVSPLHSPPTGPHRVQGSPPIEEELGLALVDSFTPLPTGAKQHTNELVPSSDPQFCRQLDDDFLRVQADDYFYVLGVDEQSTDDEIRGRYKHFFQMYRIERFKRETDPDVKTKANEILRRISQACAVLSTPHARNSHLAQRQQKQQQFRNRLVFSQEQFRQGEICIKQHRYQEAIPFFQRAIEANEKDPAIFLRLGWAIYQSSRTEPQRILLARTYIEKALRMNPIFEDAYFYLGSIRKEEGAIDEAVALFQRILLLNPGHTDAHQQLAALGMQ